MQIRRCAANQCCDEGHDNGPNNNNRWQKDRWRIRREPAQFQCLNRLTRGRLIRQTGSSLLATAVLVLLPARQANQSNNRRVTK